MQRITACFYRFFSVPLKSKYAKKTIPNQINCFVRTKVEDDFFLLSSF